jgi:predicted RNA-binding protein
MANSIYSAEEIMNYLLGENIWAFSTGAPNIKLFSEGDKAVVYLAGKGNRCFAADFTISSKYYNSEKNAHDPDWLAMFPIRIKIQNINKWTKLLPIRDVIDKLGFMQNKMNYGLYFRQSTKIINEKDYYVIV